MKSEEEHSNSSIAIIPARSGSKSVKNKNLRLFHGKPLIAWTIEQAIASKVSRVIVTTNSEEIKEVATEYGAEVPYLRSEELSNDTIGIEPVIIDVLDYLKNNQKYIPDCVALLMPTSPFRIVEDIDKALNIFQSKNVTSVVSVSRAIANQNPHWMLKRTECDEVVLFTGEELSKIKSRRQDLPDVYIRNDFVYMFSPDNLYKEPIGLYGDKVELMVVEDERADVDINTEMEWIVAETIFKQNHLID